MLNGPGETLCLDVAQASRLIHARRKDCRGGIPWTEHGRFGQQEVSDGTDPAQQHILRLANCKMHNAMSNQMGDAHSSWTDSNCRLSFFVFDAVLRGAFTLN